MVPQAGQAHRRPLAGPSVSRAAPQEPHTPGFLRSFVSVSSPHVEQTKTFLGCLRSWDTMYPGNRSILRSHFSQETVLTQRKYLTEALSDPQDRQRVR